MSTRKDDFYKQVELKRADGGSEVCWIPEELAVEGKLVHFKRDNFDASVTKAYETRATLAEIDVNRRHPLSDATDI